MCLVEVVGDVESEQYEVKLRLVVPQSFHREALLIAHDSTLGGHYGFKKTLHHAKTMFFWSSLLSSVKKHIADCITCQKRNYQGTKFGKIQSLPPVKYPLQRVGVDLIEKLSPSLNSNCFILTIVCHFSRFVQAYALRDKQANTVANAFLDFLFRYGCPEHIVSTVEPNLLLAYLKK